jgi:hypothetical protein
MGGSAPPERRSFRHGGLAALGPVLTIGPRLDLQLALARLIAPEDF